MKSLSIACGILLAAGLCAAQDSPPATIDQGADQSLAAAARASKAQHQIQADKQAEIRHLLELTHASGLATQSMDEMETTLKPLFFNSLPPGDYRDQLVALFFEKFREKRDPQHLTDLLVPVYDKYYTADEVEQLIQLYQSPLGQKMVTVLPKILAESQEAGGKWGRELGRECMTEVLAEHPEFVKQMEDAKKNMPHQ